MAPNIATPTIMLEIVVSAKLRTPKSFVGSTGFDTRGSTTRNNAVATMVVPSSPKMTGSVQP